MKKSLLYLVYSIFFFSCSSNEPIEIKPGDKKCEYCLMGIVDMRFDAQIKTHKHKSYFFDSIECAVAWKIKNKNSVKKIWVTDYYKFNESIKKYIDGEKAYYLQSENRPSPMGAYLSSYKDNSLLQNAIEETKGKSFDYLEVETYINTKWGYFNKK
ncbi:MAG: nitrous oxide reductase accessory protein NosL [Spirochaetia bacterium]|nr:nitrous oxide reductase accessory protein NosL [Spirochaetia bacterium]